MEESRLVLNRQVEKYSVSELQAGMIVAELMTSEDGKAILGAGTVLTDNRIRLLQQWGVDRVSVLLPQSRPETAQETPWSFDREAFNAYYKDTVDLVKTAFKSISLFREVPVARMQELANEKIDPLVDAPGVMNHLLMIRHTDDYTFEHSVNVAVLSGVIGKWMGLKGQNLRDLIFAGLMHDIGKSQVPPEILNKPGKLSAEEMDIMKRHTIQGYYLLKEVPRTPLVIMWSVLQHHERMDGSGYPLSLPGKKIDICGRIIAIADIYSAMTSMRSYGKRRTSYDAAATLQSDMFGKLDSQVCLQFLGRLRQFFQGNMVRLNDGRDAEVVFLNPADDSRPMVRTADGTVVDLGRSRDFSIRRVLY